ncbi:DUF4386 domain-containing protein [Jatrophihabitans telluris]|uniref:DUF4386 domain-containing protein n=1 Tax=Jatrophihabitans telluris TaxID=2038343 RepID=A0ABY4QUV7_9ACTN|nr:DUF4386 domain-containing protein [Jatrophihabitans telluris]UQX87074.1 DUF4386 domain-containing protein [Jatrophihabitans telluris]
MNVNASQSPDRMRKVALLGGLAYLATFAASMPQLGLFSKVIDDPDYILAHGSDASLRLGSILELITGLACIATAVALYPAIRCVSRSAAIGFVASRTLEAAVIFAGTMSLLALVTLHEQYDGATGAERDALGVVGQALVATRQWSFLIGPGLIPAVNAAFLGYALYRSRLVPRAIPTIGLVGAPLIALSAIATIGGLWDQTSVTGSLFALPIAAWEFSLGIYLTFKGFARSPQESADMHDAAPQTHRLLPA